MKAENEAKFNSFIAQQNQAIFNNKQVAQPLQRDCAAGWVSYGKKWKTVNGRQFYGQYRSIFNHYDEIGQQSHRIR